MFESLILKQMSVSIVRRSLVDRCDIEALGQHGTGKEASE
jgi:hypothetical protein